VVIYFLTLQMLRMKENAKKPLNFGNELTRNQQKKVLGGAANCPGKRCSKMPAGQCTTSPISAGYCAGVWFGSYLDTCDACPPLPC
jgi:hypothetical protein